jgi:hypothetical protein
MKTARTLSFLLLMCSAVAFNMPLAALGGCSEYKIASCNTSQNAFNRIGKQCAIAADDRPCSALGEMCVDYCGSAGVDLNQRACEELEDGTWGYCWCNGWQQCPQPLPPPPNCDPNHINEMNCLADNALWDPYGCYCNYSPIIVKLDSNQNYQLTDPAGGVTFDVDGDGVSERVAWTVPGTPQAFLVLDRNGNGTIDSFAEMFGGLTPLRGGGTAPNGFEALIDAERGSPAANGLLDAADPVFAQMRLWVDEDHNGISTPAELSPLASAGIVAIELRYRAADRVDDNGNIFAYVGRIRVQHHNGVKRRRVYDVYLKTDS